MVLVDHLLKTWERKEYEIFKETGDSWYIYQNKLDKACFQHDVACRDLPRRKTADKVVHDKVFNFA